MSIRIALCLIGSLLLSACGGGGGGGGGGNSGGGFTIQLQQSSVSLEYREGANVASTSIVATWRGTPPNPLYVFVVVEGPGIGAPIISINETDARATITALRLPVGEYSGRMVIRACPDSTCSSTVGGTPINVPYTVRVTPPLFTVEGAGAVSETYINHVLGQSAPTRTLNIAANTGAWTATTTQPWITLSQTSGTGAAPLVVTLRPELLSTQRMEGSVTISTSSLGAQTFNIAVLMRTPSVQASPGYLPLSGVAGAPLSLSQQVTVQIENGGTLPIGSVTANQPWLRTSSISGQSFQVSLDSSAIALPSGSHTGIVTVTLEGGVVDVQEQLQVQLTLAQAAFTTPASIVLGGDTGRDFSDVSLPLSLNTGTNAYAWTVSSPPSWLNINRISGSVAESGDTLTLQPVRAQSTPGLATTSLQFSTTINGEVITRTVPVEFALDERRLIASEVGIAFTELPGTDYDQLSRTLKVRDNYNENVAWTADDDAAWLTVTPSGSSGDDLVVTADTSGLSADQLYTARIRITTNESTIDDEEYVHVGLWVGTSMPVTNRNLGGNSPQILGDPLRPYVYVRSFNQSAIEVFNAYTGAQITTINGIPTNMVDMTASKDGQTLYILASNNIVPVNLTTYAVGTIITLPFTYGNRQVLTYARPNGVGVLLDDEGTANLATTGESVGSGGFSGEFALSGDDRMLFWAETRRSVDFSEARGKRFITTRTGTFDGGDGLFAVFAAANFDGSRVYMYRGSNVNPGRRVIVFNGHTLDSIIELQAPLEFRKLLVTSRGQAVLSKLHHGPDDVTVYNPDNSVALSGIELGDAERDVSATGDGNFVLVTTYNSAWIVPIPR